MNTRIWQLIALIATLTMLVSLMPGAPAVLGQEPTPTGETKILPFDWPIVPLTEEEISAVRQCDLENLPKQRYPYSVSSEDLLQTYQPRTDCDWAIVALAYADRLGEDEPLSEPAQQAFARAIAHNIGYALATPMFYHYFGGLSVVKAPAFTQQDITDVKIEYSWVGLGAWVDYSVEIHQADTMPVVTSTLSDTFAIDKTTVQALAPALTDLLPVSSKFRLQPCTDNYPGWSVNLTFADKTELEVMTDSNFMFIGGPWFTEIDRQVYVQFSSAFGKAVGKLIESLGLPLGEPGGMACSVDTVFDKAFP